MLEFNIADVQSWESLKPIFSAILGPGKGKVQINLTGAADQAAAETWLRAMHQSYMTALGPKRSPLLRSIDPVERVEFPQFEVPPA